MEIAVLWFLSMVAMGNEVEKTNESVQMLEAEVITLQIQNDIVFDTLEDHETTIIKTAAAHSSFYAAQQVKNEQYEQSIERLEESIELLNESN